MLPRLLVVTDRHQAAAAHRSLEETVASAVAGGARAVLLREKDLPAAARRGLARDILALLAPVGGLLLVAGDVGLAGSVGAAGVHLAAADPWPPAAGLLVGRSTHSPAEVTDAARRRAAYVTVSPVFATPSKPGYGPAIGPEGLRLACRAGGPPVYALGGVTAGAVGRCLGAGAYGVAVMGAIMGASDPTAKMAGLTAALAAAGDA